MDLDENRLSQVYVAEGVFGQVGERLWAVLLSDTKFWRRSMTSSISELCFSYRGVMDKSISWIDTSAL